MKTTLVHPATADTTEDDLRRMADRAEEEGSSYTLVPKDMLRAALERVRQFEGEIDSVLEAMPKAVVVRVREGLGEENLCASLAVSVAKVSKAWQDALSETNAARSRIAEVEAERDAEIDASEVRCELEGQIVVLESERDTARAELAAMTKDRDEWRSAASDGLSVIRSLKTDALAADGRTGEVPGDVREAAEEFMDYENDSSVSPTPVWAPGEIVARFVLSLKTAPPAAPDPTATNGG
jgi:hypothetical protein